MTNGPSQFILVGYMGAGKTVIGKRLARALGYRFVDTDHWVEEQHGMTITQLFEQKGEPFFRQAEQEALIALMGAPSQVIATGGGTMMHPPSLSLALEKGWVIYLEAAPQILFQRVSQSHKERPLLAAPDAEQQFYQRFALREPVYRKAHWTVPTEGVGGPDAVVNAILVKLRDTFGP